jgi:hypothetical protein
MAALKEFDDLYRRESEGVLVFFTRRQLSRYMRRALELRVVQERSYEEAGVG